MQSFNLMQASQQCFFLADNRQREEEKKKPKTNNNKELFGLLPERLKMKQTDNVWNRTDTHVQVPFSSEFVFQSSAFRRCEAV